MRNRKRITGLITLCLIFAVSVFALQFLFTPKAYAATRTWDGEGETNNWSEAANWSSDTVPTASDDVIFDGTSVKDVTIDQNVSVRSISITAEYGGVITQGSGFTFATADSAGIQFAMAGGTFVGGDSTIDVRTFNQTGGTFTSTSGELHFSGDMITTGGTFNHNNGTVVLDGNASSLTWNVNETLTLNHVTINATGTSSITVSANDSIIVLGIFTLIDKPVNQGTGNMAFDLRGDAVISSTDGGTACLNFGDNDVTQTITIADGAVAPCIRLDNAADADDEVVISGSGARTISNFIVTSDFSGTIPLTNASDAPLTITTWTQEAGTYDASAQTAWTLFDFNHSGGTFVGPATITATGAAATWDMTASDTTFNNFVVAKNNNVALTITTNDTIVVNGDLTLTDGLIHGTGAVAVQGDITQASTFDGATSGTVHIDFANNSVGQTYTVNGGGMPGIRFDSAADANDSLVFASCPGQIRRINITADFSGTIPITNASNCELDITFYTQAAGTYDASAQSSWILRDDFSLTGGTLTAPQKVTAAGSSSAWTIPNGWTVNDVEINRTSSLALGSSSQIITVNGLLTLTNGTLGNGQWHVMDDVEQGSGFDGAINSLNGCVRFANDSVAQTYTINGGVAAHICLDSAADANDTILVTASAAITRFFVESGFSGAIPIVNSGDHTLSFFTWSQAAGTYDASAQSVWNILNFTKTGGTFVAPTTVNISTGGTTGGSFSSFTTLSWGLNGETQIFNNFTIPVFGSGVTVFFDRGSRFIFAGDVTRNIASATTGSIQHISALSGNAVLEFQGDVTVVNGGAWGSSFLEFVFSGDKTQTLSIGAGQWDAGLIQVNKTGGSVVLANDLLLNANNQTLAIVEGELDLNGFNLTNSGTGSTTVVEDGGTLELNGTETLTLTGGLTNQSGSTVRFTGDNDDASDTITPTNYATTYHHLDLAPDDEAEIFQLGANIDINGDLTLTEGTLNVGANRTINLAGNFNVPSGDFEQEEGSVILDGTNQSIHGSHTFYDLSKSVTSPATLTFDAGATTTVQNDLVLTGVSGNRLSIRSGTEGVQTLLDPEGSITPQYLDLKDNANIRGSDILCESGCLNSGNNDGWIFPGANISAISGPTTEEGGTATFDIYLTVEPTDTVTIPISSGDTTEGTIAIEELVFTTENWSIPQTVTVTGVDDALDDGDIEYFIELGVITSNDPSYDEGNPDDVAVTNIDNDTSGIFITPPSPNNETTEEGGTSSFTLVLTAQPTGNVVITSTSTDATEGVVTSGSSRTFTTENWNTPQTVTVTGQDDLTPDGDIPYDVTVAINTGSTADPIYDLLPPQTVSFVNLDSEVLEIAITQSGANTQVTEGGATDTYEIVLTYAPTHDVIVTVHDNEDATADPTELTFTTENWNDAQTVTVTAVDDLVDETSPELTTFTHTAVSEDPLYDGIEIDDLTVRVVDNDVSGATVSPISGNTTEAGGTATFTIVLTSQPTGDVVITSTSNDETEGIVTSGASLTFTPENWDEAQTVTVTGQDDGLPDGNIPYTIIVAIDTALTLDARYDLINPADVSVTNEDDGDAAGFQVSGISGNTTEAGGTATFTIVLTSQPTGDVVILSASNDETEGIVTGGATLTFTTENWNTPQTVTVTGVDDFLDDGNILYTIVTSVDADATQDEDYAALDPDDVTATNTDNDTSGVTVGAISGPTTEDGGTATFTMVLTAQPTGNVVILSASNDETEGIVTGGATLTFTTENWNTPQTVTVTGQDDDLADGNVVYTIVTTMDTELTTDPIYAGINPANRNVTNNDNGDALGVTVGTISGNTTESGGTASFTLVLLSQPTGNVVITSVSNDATEGIVTIGATRTFTPLNWSTPQTVTITGQNDSIDDGNVEYTIIVSIDTEATLDEDYAALDPDDVTVVNVDNDTSSVDVSIVSGPTTEAGGTATFQVLLLAQPSGNVVIDVASGDTTEGVVTGGATLTFTTENWNTPQTVTVTGQDDDLADGTVAYQVHLTIDQENTQDDLYDNVVIASANLTNLDNDTAGIFVSPISGGVAEAGDTATFTIVLTSQPTDDVQISFSYDTEQLLLDPAVLTFTDANWMEAQTVTVAAVDDAIREEEHTSVLSFSVVSGDVHYHDTTLDDITVTITDNDNRHREPILVRNAAIVINEGESCTPSLRVDAILTAQYAQRVSVADNPEFADAEVYFFVPEYAEFQMLVPWTFEEGGLKTLYAIFESPTQNRSDIVSDDILVSQSGCELDDTEEEEGEETPEPERPAGPVHNEHAGEKLPAPGTGMPELVEYVFEGELIRGITHPEVYLLDVNERGVLVRRPFWNEPLYYTHFPDFSYVRFVSDVTLTTVPMGTSMYPKEGTTLLTFESIRGIFWNISEDAKEPKLRQITTEHLLRTIVGADWSRYVIELPGYMQNFAEIFLPVIKDTDITVDRAKLVPQR